ncbi:hypothetical protein HAX54_028716, partial [Datura stramonium]|nr:hypothetical protein [Datura stramonium]
ATNTFNNLINTLHRRQGNGSSDKLLVDGAYVCSSTRSSAATRGASIHNFGLRIGSSLFEPLFDGLTQLPPRVVPCHTPHPMDAFDRLPDEGAFLSHLRNKYFKITLELIHHRNGE